MSKTKGKALMDERAQQRQRLVDDAGPVLYVTSRNVEVECLPIAAEIEAQEQNIRQAIEWADPPTHTITDVADATMQVAYTEKSIAADDVPEADKQKWADYLAAQAAAQAEYKRRIEEGRPRLIAYRGVRVTDEALPTRWAQDHTWLGMEVPDDPRERSLHFFMTEILGNIPGDLNSILLGIYRASGYDADLLDKAEAFFRSQMGRRERPDDRGDTGDIGAQDEEGAPGLVDGAGLE